MRTGAFSYVAGSWSPPLSGDLDSDRTLVLVVAAPEYRADPQPLDEFKAAFPS